MMLNSSGLVIKVGIAQMDVVKLPNTIRTSGLGSCVGVILYDESKKNCWFNTCDVARFKFR